MGVRTRGLDIKAGAKRAGDDRAARADAKTVVDRWNEQLAAGRDMLWSPTIRAALLAGTPWLDVFCPGCGTSRAIDLRTIDRHPMASVGTLVSACGAHGVQGRRRCRSYSACSLCGQRGGQTPRRSNTTCPIAHSIPENEVSERTRPARTGSAYRGTPAVHQHRRRHARRSRF
jgi:hypothetical protein